MSVRKEASGRRSVQVEVEVPGTPEEVWQAIATGPGISSWFLPTDVEQREGGAIAFEFGSGITSFGKVTGWEPPHRFAYEEADWSPNAPPLASEFFVEARSGGSCVVRVVNSLFSSSADWDDQLASMETGWRAFFDVLRLYLTHFRGQRCAPISFMSGVPGPESKAWQALNDALGLTGVSVGEHRKATSLGAPPFAGVVEQITNGNEMHNLILRLEEPAPGLATLSTFRDGNQVQVAIGLYLYGDGAPATATREEPLWRAWMNEHFPAARTDVASTDAGG